MFVRLALAEDLATRREAYGIMSIQNNAMVCNALVQQGHTKVRCSFWGDHAHELASQPANQALLLYQVLVTKRKSEASWELTSWRGTTIQPCPTDIAETLMLCG